MLHSAFRRSEWSGWVLCAPLPVRLGFYEHSFRDLTRLALGQLQSRDLILS